MPVFRTFRTVFVLSLIFAAFFFRCNSGETTSYVEEEAKLAFRNHHPGVNYIGMAECATCHVDKYLTFQHTGKGRAFHAPDTANIVEDFDNALVYDRHSNLYYRPYWKGSEMFIHEFRLDGSDTVHSRTEKVHYVIGSGNQTRSYIRELKGYFYEMPITWYVSKKLWDLSPGYEEGLNSRFNRPVGDLCMSCHNSDVQFVKHSVNRFKNVGSGIECEKCHGPGEAHMQAAMNEQELEGSIVNPADLSAELRFDICRQCHLEGVVVEKDGKYVYDYRPGMPLSAFYDVFIPVEENETDFGFASHAERLQMSACFKGMNGKMACTNCHDPHQAIQTNSREYFNNKCLSCHQVDACGEEHQTMVEAQNDCVLCHMKKGGTEDIPHVSSTDHLIRVLDSNEVYSGITHHQSNGVKAFKSFTSEQVSERTRALLHMNYYEQFEGDKAYLRRVQPLVKSLKPLEKVRYVYLLGEGHEQVDLSGFKLEEVRDPYSCYHIYMLYKRKGQEQRSWLEQAVALAPENQDFVLQLASSYDNAGMNQAEMYYQKLLQLNPRHPQGLVNFGFFQKEHGKTEEAITLFKKAVENFPDYQLAMENLALCYIETNAFNEAEKVLDRLVRQYPDNSRYRVLLQRIRSI